MGSGVAVVVRGGIDSCCVAVDTKVCILSHVPEVPTSLSLKAKL